MSESNSGKVTESTAEEVSDKPSGINIHVNDFYGNVNFKKPEYVMI